MAEMNKGDVYWQSNLPDEQARASEMIVRRVEGNRVYFTRADEIEEQWQTVAQFQRHTPKPERRRAATTEPVVTADNIRVTDDLALDDSALASYDPTVDYPPGAKLSVSNEERDRYAALGRAAESNGLAWYAPDGRRGEMLFQPPADVIAEQAVAKFIEGNGLSKLETPTKAAPVPMLLNCPSCGERHIDEGEFAGKPHHTHACQSCGMVWRPALVDTVGVKFLPGFKNV